MPSAEEWDEGAAEAIGPASDDWDESAAEVLPKPKIKDFDYTAVNPVLAPVVAAARALQPGTKERAATLGAAQGGTFGFVDEIGGALGKALGVGDSGLKLGKGAMPSVSDTPEVRAAKEELLRGEAERPDSYTLVRDKLRDEAHKAERDQGGAYLAGNVAGGVLASSLLPGGYASAAAQGAASGMGQSEAKDLTGMYADTALGAGVGVAGQFVGNMVGKGIGRVTQAIPESVRNFANARAVKAATGQNKREIGKMIAAEMRGSDVGTIDRVGKDLLDQGVVTAGANASDIAERAAARRSEFGQAINSALDELDSLGHGGVDMDALAQRMSDELVNPNLRGTLGQRNLAKRMSEEIGVLQEQGGGLRELEDFKRALDDSINYAAEMRDPAQKALLRMRTMLNEAIEQKADDIAQATGSDAAQRYLESKAITGSMGIGERVAKNQATAQMSNRLVAPSDYGMGAAGAVGAAALGGALPLAALQGAAIAGGHKLVRTRGNQVAAAAANRLANSDFIQNLANVNPSALGDYAGVVMQAVARGNFPVVHYALWQRDPEYRAAVENARKGAEQ